MAPVVSEESALSSFTVDEAAGLLADPAAFTNEARMHAGLSYLRANAPVVRVDRAPYPPFWAVTKHADVMEIERDHALWINGKGSLLTTAAIDASLRTQNDDGIAMRTMNQMDGQDHRALRAIAADWFRPKAMRALQTRVDELARRYVDHMSEIGPECDFVTEVAANYPGYVILSLLGLPDDDYPLIQRLTNELFGLDDPEQQRGSSPENVLDVLADIFAYFDKAAASRRANPTADLTSAIANARVDGRHLSDSDVVNTCQLIATAGHDTTKSAVAGGLLAGVEPHPTDDDRPSGIGDRRGRVGMARLEAAALSKYAKMLGQTSSTFCGDEPRCCSGSAVQPEQFVRQSLDQRVVVVGQAQH